MHVETSSEMPRRAPTKRGRQRPPHAHYHLHLLLHPRHTSSLFPCGYYHHHHHQIVVPYLSQFNEGSPPRKLRKRTLVLMGARAKRPPQRPASASTLLLVLLTWAFVDSMMYHMVLLSPTSTHETKVVNEAVAEVDLTVTVDDCLRIEHQIDNTLRKKQILTIRVTSPLHRRRRNNT